MKFKRDVLNELLNGVRETRNALAHFRGDISAEQRDKLKFAVEWLSRRQEDYQHQLEKEENQKLMELFRQNKLNSIEFSMIREESSKYPTPATDPISSTDFTVTEASTGGGRYAALADWLQSQPGRIDTVQLDFTQIEEIIKTDLPASARKHRAWWANDSVGHSHSQLWLEAGWRSTYINLSDGKVTFSRIREREKAYISFFSKLLEELRENADFPVKEVSPDGASWIVIRSLPTSGGSFGIFTFSFSRDKRLRVELYLDLGNQDQTKAVFDQLFEQKDNFESLVGDIEWERLNNRRASRLALYHPGHIYEEEQHTDLRKWAVETMIKFHNALVEPADSAILAVKNK